MVMDTDNLSHMLAEITNGVPKAESRYAKSAEDKATWDEVAADVDQIKATGGEVQMLEEIPPAYEPTGATKDE